ncbi:MAG: OmpA family protein [Gallionellaceae bacterium]|nr:OmpA family protein [Gallionellaceae bacterium]
MKRVAKTVTALSLAGCAVINSAVADDSNWYLGGNIGQSRAKIDDTRITAQLVGVGFATTSIVDENRSAAYKLFAGYKVGKNFALEGGYFDIGKFGFTSTTIPAGTLTGKIKLRGVNIDAVGILPITEQFAVFGRAGLNYAQARDNFSSTGLVPAPVNPNPSKSEANYKFGMGLQYDFTESLGMRAEAERYRINDAVSNKGDINMYSLGLVYRFGVNKPSPVTRDAASESIAAREPIVAVAPVQVIVPVTVRTAQYCSILDFQFEIKQDDIQREEKERLSVFGTFMNKYPDTTAVIEGHTDDVGTSEYNWKLSQRRAESVVSYLVDNFHIATSRLTAVGYGEMRPIADNSTRQGQQMNRRIGAVVACATDIEGLKVAPARVTMAMEMEFDPYKHTIEPQYYDELGKVANFLKANPSVTATVEGHAGKFVGNTKVPPELAMDVSKNRAQSVVNYLVNKQGISPSRLSVEGFGQVRRVSYGTSLEGQQENRRVNIIFNYAK